MGSLALVLLIGSAAAPAVAKDHPGAAETSRPDRQGDTAGELARMAAGPADGDAVPQAAGISVTPVLTGLDTPVAMAFSGDRMVFVAEKAGRVRRYDISGATAPVTTLDLRKDVYDHTDRGLLGLTLDPKFDSGRPYLYVLYSYDRDPFGEATVPRWGGAAGGDGCATPPGGTEDGCTSSGRLVRYTIATDGTVVPASETLILDGAKTTEGGWCHQFPSHSIGTVAFGPDGNLYVSAGDGASYSTVDYGQYGGSPGSPTPANPCADLPGKRGTPLLPGTSTGGALRSQALRATTAQQSYVTWDGAILRIDPTTGKAVADNPLVNNGIPGDDRIVAYGLRNPFRFGFRPDSNELWLGDVGWNQVEEVNRFTTGPNQQTVPNFGWPCYEGDGPQGGYAAAEVGLCESLYAKGTSDLHGVQSPLLKPVFAWTRDGQKPAAGCRSGGGGSAVGGAFVHNTSWPAKLQGAYVFADFVRGCLAVMPLTNGQPDPTKVEALVTNASAVSVLPGPSGDLFYTDIVAGSIMRIRSAAANRPPVARFSATPSSGEPPMTVRFDASASSDPDGLETLSYTWDLDGDQACDDATGPITTHTYVTAGAVTITLCAADPLGETGTSRQTLQVGNTPPKVSVTGSADSTRWKVGDPLVFTAKGVDAEDRTLPDSAYKWSFEVRHCSNESDASCHTHLLSTATGARVTITAPEHEYYAYVRGTVTVTDSAGASVRAVHDARARVSTVTLATSPAGAKVSAGPTSGTSPLTAKFLEGGRLQLIAPHTLVSDGKTLVFAGWDDAPAAPATRLMAAPAGARTYTANYQPPAPPVNLAPSIGPVALRPTRATIRRHGRLFTMAAQVSDASGVARVYGRINLPNHKVIWVPMHRFRGTAANGTWIGSVKVSYRKARAGRWTTSVSAADSTGLMSGRFGPTAVIRKRR